MQTYIDKKQPLIVHKFGGSGLASSEKFTHLRQLLTGKHEIIVVSATLGTTNTLQNLIQLAQANKPYTQLLEDLKNQHIHLVESLLSIKQANTLRATLIQDITNINSILGTISLIGTTGKPIIDKILGYGELWSAKILSQYLKTYHHTLFLDATKVLITYLKAERLQINWERTQQCLQEFLAGKSFDQIVITGFIAADEQGKPTLLGRNGSDFSAAIFAKLFKATQLIIWTDSDGVYSADPRKVRSAFVLKHLSYEEAADLAYFGAKVIHPQTIIPAVAANIPIWVKNINNPTYPGTLIANSQPDSDQPNYLIKGLTSIDEIALINIEGNGMIGVSGIATRIFHILEQNNISVILISQASSEHSICLAIQQYQADLAIQSLTDHFQFEIKQYLIKRIYAIFDCSILAVVGNGMVGNPGIAAKLCNTLAKMHISIRAIAQGSSERNISVVIPTVDIKKALRAVHAGFYLSAKTLSIGLIGPGQVGKTLLNQLSETIAELKKKYQINFCVRGIMASQKMLLDHNSIDLKQWQNRWQNDSQTADLNQFMAHIVSDDMPHAVIIDCTASPLIADHYLQFIDNGIHIITPNKRANSENLSYYQQVKALAAQKSRQYLYETTVCAGLPIIKTLQDLLDSGDTITSIEGVVSGTLSYVFNAISTGQAFSEVIYQAKQAGYTEPDPRDDLSGMDVARKFVCLGRELGMPITLDQLTIESLVPPPLKTGDVAYYLAQLPKWDNHMANLWKPMLARGEKPCYVGTIDKQGVVKIAIKGFLENHPFARLRGTDNMLIFYSKRYCTQPLVIQGPGAGTEVTAAGVFADLLRLAASLS